MKAKLIYLDEKTEIVDCLVEKSTDVQTVRLQKSKIQNVNYVDFLFDEFRTPAGSEGYFISDAGTNGTYLTRFTTRDDREMVHEFSFMGCYGWNRGSNGTVAIVTGCRCDFGMVLHVKNGIYSLFPRFYFDGDEPSEDICVELHELKNGTYSDMARCYRDYQLSKGGCIPLADRIKTDPRLKKSANSISVRIRQGWKPAPSPVEEQTPETEPPMHVAVTFDRVREIAESYQKAGITGVEFCLVGWNIGGHDGRFPQIFPVDERLGGEEKLKALIRDVQNMGYSIVCHDDATAAYSIADCFDESFLLKNKDGSLHKRPYCWSGGRPYKICPKCQYELFEKINQPKIRALGFEGIHYIDVITILPLLKCYDPNHAILSREETADWYRKIMKLAKQTFGGFSSESGFDFAASDTDYVMYPTFRVAPDEKTPLCDRIVPFFHLVYHGIMLYNPSTYTLNYPAKSVRNRLKYFEFGGRPLACYYANFAVGNNWMGLEDMLCGTEEEMNLSTKRIRQMVDDYAQLEPERFAFIESHEEIAPEVFRTTYTNGTEVTVDYQKETVKIKRRKE